MGREVLDRLVVDCNNVPCGRVDDLALVGEPGTQLRITKILIGVRPASDRLPTLARYLIQKLFTKWQVEIGWSEVEVITDHIKLKSTATELGLDENDTFAVKLINALPGSWKK